MEALGLGDFCLELHSEKARKRALLDDIERSLKRRVAQRSPDGAVTLAQLRAVRRDLATYGEALLATIQGHDESVHAILARAAVLRVTAQKVQLPQALARLNLKAEVSDAIAVAMLDEFSALSQRPSQTWDVRHETILGPGWMQP